MSECTLCFHHCILSEGQIGFCRARKNENGKIVPLSYGHATSVSLDPIEKKPLHRFYPGSRILSIGSFGCNLRCPFCQNHDISMADQRNAQTTELPPAQAVKLALELLKQGNIGIAYTYNEPLISYEYVYDTAKLTHEAGLKNVLVTNGTIEEEPLRRLMPYIDALNIDLKGFSQDFYDQLHGDFASVKRTIKIANETAHVEITTLIIPGENDSEEDMENEAKWIASLDPDIPLHLSRFFPHHLWKDRPITPIETLRKLEVIAKKHLNHVYLGNV